MSPEYQDLNRILQKRGLSGQNFLDVEGVPMDTLVNNPKISSEPYVDTLLAFLPKVSDNEKEMIVRALAEKGNSKAVLPLIEMFHSPNKYSELLLWAVGNALCEIDDQESYSDIIEICKNRDLGISRQMLFLKILPKIQSDKAYKVLIAGLKDNHVRGHALDGLGKFGNPAAIESIERTVVQNGKYEFKAKERALNKLRKKKLG
nr:hypothetical protein [Allomuricauda sp.]